MRRRFSEMGERELIALGRCSWETQSGMPWTRRCGRKVTSGHFYCSAHERDYRDLYPHRAVPMARRDPAHKRARHVLRHRRTKRGHR